MVVNTLDDLAEDPHLVATGFWHLMEHPSEGSLRMPGVATDFSETPGDIRQPPPHLGEHLAEVLKDAGLTDAEIDDLVNDGTTIV